MRYVALDSFAVLHSLGHCISWNEAHEIAAELDTNGAVLAILDEDDARNIYERIESFKLEG